MSNQEPGVVAHLARLLQSIEDDLVIPLQAHEAANRGGHLGVSRQVFCYFDYLGGLAYSSNPGRSTTKDAVQFMDTYLVRVDDAYRDRCELLYNMWRNGTVHEHDPKEYTTTDKQFRLRWMANNSSAVHNRQWHLACLCSQGRKDLYYWSINVFQLVDDLKSSIRFFMSDLESDEAVRTRALANLERLSEAECLDSDAKERKLLIAAEGLVAKPVGVVDNYGTVVKELKSQADRDSFKREWGEGGLT